MFAPTPTEIILIPAVVAAVDAGIALEDQPSVIRTIVFGAAGLSNGEMNMLPVAFLLIRESHYHCCNNYVNKGKMFTEK